MNDQSQILSKPIDNQTVKLPEPCFLPGEKSADFGNLKASIFADFLPKTMYERTLVNDLVSLEWEKLRHQKMREKTIQGKFGEIVDGFFRFGKPEPRNALMDRHDTPAQIAKNRVLFERVLRTVLDPNHEQHKAVLKTIENAGHSIEGFVAYAYNFVADEVAHHEQMIAQIEKRRRRLVDDINHLRGSRARTISADVIS